jgi:DNA invertase Pin-like site-specific DNA recombinase
VSGDRQRSGRAGLEAQRGAIAAACRRQRWQLLELVEEIGRSAEDAKRPGIAEPLRLLEAADKQALVAAKRDRLSRVLLDLASLVATAQQQGWALVALDCALEPTPTEEATANLLATFAPFERQLISQRTTAALAATRAHGVRLGRPPTISQYGDRPNQTRANSRQEPGRDRERTQRRPHPHRPRRPPLVPRNHPLHTQPNNLTSHPVAEWTAPGSMDT